MIASLIQHHRKYTQQRNGCEKYSRIIHHVFRFRPLILLMLSYAEARPVGARTVSRYKSLARCLAGQTSPAEKYLDSWASGHSI